MCRGVTCGAPCEPGGPGGDVPPLYCQVICVWTAASLMVPSLKANTRKHLFPGPPLFESSNRERLVQG